LLLQRRPTSQTENQATRLSYGVIPTTAVASVVIQFGKMEMNGPEQNSKKRYRSNNKKCFAFQKGNCQHGDSCKFRHTVQGDASGTGTGRSSSSSAADPLEMPIKKMLTETPNRQIIKHHPSTHPAQQKLPQAAAPAPVQEMKENPDADTIASHLTEETFASLPVSENLIRGVVEKMGYTQLTEVQSKSLPGILSGKDCLARAKTGTGKTLAFLIPAIERLLRRIENTKGRKPTNAISTLILSPTRELANQIGKEAIKLLHFLPNHRVVTLTGGTNRNTDIRNMNNSITILVATPGRLVDHLDNTEGIAERCQLIDTLVLDEADVLLEMGFKPALDRIMSYIGHHENRQTLLFSATISSAVQQIAATVLHSGYTKIDTIGEEVGTNHTHEHVEQTLFISSMEYLIPSLLLILREQIQISNYKIIVFFTTARMTGYMAAIFRYLPEFANILEIHSRKSQSHRTKSSEQFRNLHHSILFSSDVSARGMDYPNVTFVLQVGLTEKEQYIHRLGRTARAGKSGSGSLLLCDFEENSMINKTLRSLPLQRQTLPSDALISAYQTIQHIIETTRNDHEMRLCGEQAYQAWLGFYNSNLRACNWDKGTLVVMANKFAEIIGFAEPPALEAKTVGKMGLKGVKGLRIERRNK
jgi:ATP-dependent RNA helicase MSS116, mitochondrial